ncbi:MAG: hypothetical protein LBT74_08435 [Acidobacteriota bacterium]|nr:hypothetical protein [Acidobacteriota bacterium]
MVRLAHLRVSSLSLFLIFAPALCANGQDGGAQAAVAAAPSPTGLEKAAGEALQPPAYALGGSGLLAGTGMAAAQTSLTPPRDPFPPFPARWRSPGISYRMAQGMYVGSIVADLGTTWNLPKGMTEGNPLLGNNRPQQVGVSGAMAALVLWQSRSFYRKGNTRAAQWILWVGTAAHTFAAAYNAHHWAN